MLFSIGRRRVLLQGQQLVINGRQDHLLLALNRLAADSLALRIQHRIVHVLPEARVVDRPDLVLALDAA